MLNETLLKVATAIGARQRLHHLDRLALESIAALETVEREMARAGSTHPIPLRISRAVLDGALQITRNDLDVRLIKLQLRLLDEGKAKPSGTQLDFEIFSEILGQHNIAINLVP